MAISLICARAIKEINNFLRKQFQGSGLRLEALCLWTYNPGVSELPRPEDVLVRFQIDMLAHEANAFHLQ